MLPAGQHMGSPHGFMGRERGKSGGDYGRVPA